MDFQKLIEQVTQFEKKTVAVAAAEDLEVLEAISLAVQQNMSSFQLYGDKEMLTTMLDQHFPHLVKNKQVEIIHTLSQTSSAELAVKAVRQHEADVLMKGHIPTSTLLKAVLNKEIGLRTGKVLSHVAVFSVPGYERFIFVTDAAMNIAPDVSQKAQIIANAVKVAKSLGLETPKVAPLAAVEVVNPDMQASLDAALLTQMNRRGQITDCEVDGPLALDNAVSMEAAKHKGINSTVAGQADILLVPNIESGNILYKSLVYFSNASVGAVIEGAKAPIVLTSRADSAESKLYSLAVALHSSIKQ
ncbi:phosphate butyryltransferase [Bacillus carboniphilus]|uniref:Phosphate butyryltransferase n=1 Tax=Bacillus carboniphilus TaxID=86663 RepID=A0ABP3GLM0_9BACI